MCSNSLGRRILGSFLLWLTHFSLLVFLILGALLATALVGHHFHFGALADDMTIAVLFALAGYSWAVRIFLPALERPESSR